MRATLLLLVALAAPAVANQVVWKWVDKEGVTHYSDRPVAGASRVELNVSSRSEPSPPPSSSDSVQSRPAPGTLYRTFEVSQPRDNETLVNTGGRVTVSILLEPSLQPGHVLHLYLDGRRMEGFPENATSYVLNEVPRGTHSAVGVISNRGARVQETASVTFHVRQESTAQPPTGPSVRPPPKPRTSNKLPSSQPNYAALSVQLAPVDPATNELKAPKPAPVTPKKGN